MASVVPDLPLGKDSDTREKNPMMVNALAFNEALNQMRKRHLLMKELYPDKPAAHGPAFTGLSNTRPETQAISDPSRKLEGLPYNVKKLIEMELPWAFQQDPDLGQ